MHLVSPERHVTTIRFPHTVYTYIPYGTRVADRIRIQFLTLMRIRIQLFTVMRVRIQLFTLMRIRIRVLLLIKVMQICNYWSTDPLGLYLGPPRLHCERHFSIYDLQNSSVLTLMRIRVQLFTLLHIRILIQLP